MQCAKQELGTIMNYFRGTGKAVSDDLESSAADALAKLLQTNAGAEFSKDQAELNSEIVLAFLDLDFSKTKTSG